MLKEREQPDYHACSVHLPGQIVPQGFRRKESWAKSVALIRDERQMRVLTNAALRTPQYEEEAAKGADHGRIDVGSGREISESRRKPGN